MSEIKKFTINDFKAKKEAGEVISWVSIYDYPMAYYADQAGIDCIFVGDSSAMTVLGYPNTLSATMEQMLMMAGAVSRAVTRSFIIGDLPYMSYQTGISDAVRNAGLYMSQGHVDAVKCEGGAEVCETIAAIVKWGIPCHGHIGVTPQSLSAQGGYKSRGRTVDTAVKLIDDAISLEQAGVFCMVVECVPQQITDMIRQHVNVPIISIGGGPADGQLLISHDLLGIYPGHTPKFIKKYANLGEQMLNAFKAYKAEVSAGIFPGPEQCYNIPAEDLETIKAAIKRRGM